MMQHSARINPPMQRRTLLQLGAVASVAFGLAGFGLSRVQPGLQDGRPGAESRELFAAVARAVLDGILPSADAGRAALEAHLQRVDATIQGFAPATQRELSQLLSILTTAAGRRGLAGLATPWATASVAEVQAALQDMRTSRIGARQQIYHALRDITNGAWFADASTWPLLGYPGPRDV